MKIAHISDIHWRGLSRHIEYTRAFEAVFAKLREIRPDLIFLGGDYFHTKTSGISPEVIDRLAWMFKSFGDIAPTHAILGNHDCFTEDHEVLTRDGWESISSIVEAKQEKEVATFNSTTEQIEFQLPHAWISKSFTGELLHLQGKELDALVTPTHEFLYGFSNKKYYKTAARNLPSRSCIPTSGLYAGSLADKDWFASLLGFAFAEGTFVLRNTQAGTCRIQFHLKSPRELSFLKLILKQLAYKTNFRVQRDGTTVACIYETLAKRVFSFFEGKKEIPNNIFAQDKRFLRSFLEGYLQGDGGNKKNAFWTFHSISKSSRDTLVTIARLVGANSHSNPNEIYGNYPGSGRQYGGSCNLTNKVHFTKVSTVKPVPFSGMVYCVTVQNSNLLVRRNGKIFVAGNCNLSNEDRQNVISPIVNAMGHPGIYLYKNSGNYPVPKMKFRSKAVFNVFSCFDKPGWDKVAIEPGAVNIAAFHGSVGGTQMDNGWVMPDSKAEVMLSMFDGYDFVLLGDIHKRQFLAQRPDKNGVLKPHIAYPGSTIQQNFGEDESKGFLVWDIRAKDDWDVEFVEVQNFQPFITIPWKDTVEDTIKALQGSRTVLPGSRYRVTSQTPLNPLLTRQIEHELKTVLRGEDVTFKAQGSLSFDTILSNGVCVKKSSLRNDRNVIHGFYKQFLDLNVKKYPFTKEQLLEGLVVIDKYLDKLAATEPETARDVNWGLKSFEFDNLYRYGPGNKIDFDTVNGVLGVFGKNKTGKSSLVGALMYALFNGSDREGVTKNGQVMNQTKKSCFARAVVNVNGTDYIIERSSTRAEAPKRGKKAQEEFDTEKTETKLAFFRVNPDGTTEALNGTSRDETDKNIRKLLGTPQDFLTTSVATQRKMEAFIDEGATARKAILSRFLDLDIFEKLHGYAKDDVAALNAKTSAYTMGWEQAIRDNEALILKGEQDVLSLDDQIAEAREKLDALRLWIAQNESASATQATMQLLKVQQELFSLKRQQDRTDLDLNQLNAAMVGMDEEIQQLQQEHASTDVLLLQANLDKMRTIQKILQDTQANLRDEERTLGAKEKSIRKLTLVPCGDQFPTCMYIKESHEDKQTIEGQKTRVAALADSLQAISAELKVCQEEQYAEKMNHHLKVEQSIKELTKEQAEKNARKVLLEKAKKDLALRFQQAKKQEEELSGLAENQDVEALKAKKEELRSGQTAANLLERQRSELLVRIGKSKATLEQIQKDKAECDILLARLRILESVQAAFYKNGIPAIVLKTQLPAINAELSKLLGGLVDFKVTFETEPGSNVMDVFIEDGHSRRILELGSGMEKMLASIAIRVALINLSSLPKSDIFVIDEGFNALDEEHVGKCLELLQTLKGYFKSVMVISHMQRVKEAADNIIEVVSAGSDSRIEG